MDRSPDMELVNHAIEKLLEERRNKAATADDDDDEQILLSKLLSQLEQLKTGDAGSAGEVVSPGTERGADLEEEKTDQDVSAEELAKEIKEVKKQNSKTHWLLSALIVLTLTWQLSEFSLLLKIKDGLSHPFRSLGSMVMGRLKRPREIVMDAEKLVQPSKRENDNQKEGLPVPPHKMPGMPQIGAGQNGED